MINRAMSEFAINQDCGSSSDITEDVCGFIEKKEDGNKWIKYWVVLQTGRLKHYTCVPTNQEKSDGGYLIGWIELTRDTKCTIIKQKNNQFPFFVEKPPGKRYLFRLGSSQSRLRWVQEIEKSVKQLNVMPAINSHILQDTRERLSSSRRLSDNPSQNTAIINGDSKSFDLIDKKTRSLSLESNFDSEDSGSTIDGTHLSFDLENDAINREITNGKVQGGFRNIFLSNNKKGSKYEVV